MSGATSIEWTDESSNPLRAYNLETGKRGWFCVHVSEGCRNCYAEVMNKWVGNRLAYTAPNAAKVRLEMDVDELSRWEKLKPGTKVFPFDMTDLFQEAVPDSFIDLAFAAMLASPATFQILTKRAERRRRYLTDPDTPRRIGAWFKGNLRQYAIDVGATVSTWPMPNVWQMVSVEDQRTADERVPELIATPATVRGVSYEPGLGPVNFTSIRVPLVGQSYETFSALHATDGLSRGRRAGQPRLDWIVVGGESGRGKKPRPFNVRWAMRTRDDCRAAGVAFFMKQWGSRPCLPSCSALDCSHPDCDPGWIKLRDRKGGDPSEWKHGPWPRQFPEVAA